MGQAPGPPAHAEDRHHPERLRMDAVSTRDDGCDGTLLRVRLAVAGAERRRDARWRERSREALWLGSQAEDRRAHWFRGRKLRRGAFRAVGRGRPLRWQYGYAPRGRDR